MIKVVIPGEPVPKGRPRVTRYGTYTPKKTQLAEKAVKEALTRMPKFEAGRPLGAQIEFFLGIPKSASKTRQKAMREGLLMPTKRPDLDNLAKLVLDAMNKDVFPDDSAIVELYISKFYDDNPRTEIELWEVEP